MTPNYNTASDLGIEGVVPTPIHKLLSIRMHAMIQYVVHAEHVITGQQKLLSIRMHAMIQYVVHAEHVITGQQTK